MGVDSQRHAPDRFLPPEKIRYQSYRRLGGPQSRSGRVRKILHSPGFDPRTVQPIKGSPAEIPTPIYGNLIGRSMTALPSVLSPSSILSLPSHSLHSPTPQANACSGFNLLTPNDDYSGRTAPLTSKVAFYIFIQQI